MRRLLDARGPVPWRTPAVALTALVAWLPLLPTILPLLSLSGLAQLGEPALRTLFWHSLQVAAGAAVVSVVLGAPLAWLATRTDVPGAALLELALPLPLLLPPLLLAQAWHGLTGMEGPLAATFALGAACAPFPGLLVARALRLQPAEAHEAALLCGGPAEAVREMARAALPAAALGAGLAFLCAAGDFAVLDYFAWVGAKFNVYSFEVFHRARNQDFRSAAAAAGPLVLAAALVLYAGLWLRDRWTGVERPSGRTAPPLRLGRWRAPALLAAVAAVSVLLLLPLGRILHETGRAGPLSPESWTERSARAFSDALNRYQPELARSLFLGALAGAVAMALAPVWAHALVASSGSGRRILTAALALPLLAPALGFGLGGIAIYNRAAFGGFYESPLLPALLLAGRYLPVAVFLLAERLQRVPREQEDAAALAGLSFPLRLFRYRLGAHRGAWWLGGGLVAAFAVRELDLAVFLPGANATAVVRYYNALHYGRDNFVAAFALFLALLLFLPVALAWASRAVRPRS